MSRVIALIGNPNSGKTTLFNNLTGNYQKTGNWTGVTTEEKLGYYKKDKGVKIYDLPGIYSINSGIAEEKVVINFLKNKKPDVIINVVDGTNLERNLFLTTELLELNIPLIIAVNMYDELLNNGIKIKVDDMIKQLGVSVVPISAVKNLNVEQLIKESLKTTKSPKGLVLCVFKGKDVVEKRFKYIEKHISDFIIKKTTKTEIVSQKIDNVLTHKFWGIPIFILVITAVYFITINAGGFFSRHIESFFENLASNTRLSLEKINASKWVISLLCDAVFNGVGTVLSFLPQIIVLFFLMTIIEQSGYASRIAFILDRIFRKFGLSGKSIIPMIVGCGCTVTGLMASRTIESNSERKATIFLTPFMPCSAKLAVFSYFSYKFFSGMAIVATSMYFLSLVAVVISGLILKRFKPFNETEGGFILEMPSYRMPSLKDLFIVIKEKVKEFTAKAGSIIFLVSVALWLLMNFGFNGYANGIIENSFLYMIGNAIKYLFYPLGFGSWQASVAVISGFMAKEAVIETLEITGGINLFTNVYQAYAFMTFILLSPPCIASLGVAKRELKSTKSLIGMMVFQTGIGYLVALFVNSLSFLTEMNLLLTIVVVIIVILLTCFSVKRLIRKKCKLCRACDKGNRLCKTGKHYTI